MVKRKSWFSHSPIETYDELFETIKHIHFESHKLCKTSFGKYLDNSGNIGIFCHYDFEFNFLKQIQQELVHPSENSDQKYFELKKPILIEEQDGIPETSYTHLYIRRPDPYRHQAGDIDFYLAQKEYKKLKQEMLQGKKVEGARIFERPDLDMIELHNPDIDVLAYVSTEEMTDKVKVKLSEHTKL